jgi:hypothetical protein
VQEATVVVQQMENAIEEQGQRLSEAHDEYQRHLRLSERARRQAVMYQKFSKEELAEELAFANELLASLQAPERRRARLREVVLFVLGAAVSAILNTDAIRLFVQRLLNLE